MTVTYVSMKTSTVALKDINRRSINIFGSSAVAERPRDALCPSVVSLYKITSLLILLLRFQIYHCVTLSSAQRWGFLSYTSSVYPAINWLRRLPETHKLPWCVAAKGIALAAGTVHSVRWSQILAKNRDFCLPLLHPTPPVMGVPVGILPWRLVWKN